MKLLIFGELALIGLIPFGAGCVFAIGLRSIGLAILFGGLGGVFAAPMLCGILDTSLRSLRDEPGFWWMTYRAAWKQNVKSALLPGVVSGAAMGSVIFSLYFSDMASMSNSALMFSFLGVLLLIGMMLLVLVQIPLMQLSFFSDDAKRSDGVYSPHRKDTAFLPLDRWVLRPCHRIFPHLPFASDDSKHLVSSFPQFDAAI